jgi:D-lactate dehydrogenase
VLITGYQAFFTHEALTNIAETTTGNISAFASSGRAVKQFIVVGAAVRSPGRAEIEID